MTRTAAGALLSFVLFASPCFTADAAGQEPVQCGPEDEKNEITKPKNQQSVPAPSPGKAMVVVMYKGIMGKSYQVKLSVDGQWRAVLKKNQFSFFEIDPGVRRLCWGGRVAKRDDNYLLLTAQAGQTYYILGTFRDGITEIDPAEGQKVMAKYDYVTFTVRSSN
jgi:hypothetical protein